MGKRKKSLPPLTPRAREAVTYVVNAVALGTHDDDGEIGAMAKKLGTTPGRLLAIVRKLEQQGYLRLKNDFVYPTAAALEWQNPTVSESEAKRIVKELR
jgi:hypothetical protein